MHLTSFAGRSSQVLGAICCHVGIEASFGDLLTMEKKTKLPIGAANTECWVSFTISLKLNLVEPPKVAMSQNHSPSSWLIPNQKIGEKSYGFVSLIDRVSSSLSKNSFMVMEHHMAVSSCLQL
jgi:hypothetical protein